MDIEKITMFFTNDNEKRSVFYTKGGLIRREQKEKANPREIGFAKEVVPSLTVFILVLYFSELMIR